MPDYVDNIIELKNNQEFTEEQVNKMKELFTNEMVNLILINLFLNHIQCF